MSNPDSCIRGAGEHCRADIIKTEGHDAERVLHAICMLPMPMRQQVCVSSRMHANLRDRPVRPLID